MDSEKSTGRYPRTWNGKVEVRDALGVLVVLTAEVTIESTSDSRVRRVRWLAEGLRGIFTTCWHRWGNGLAQEVQSEMTDAYQGDKGL